MPKYRYEATDRRGVPVHGTADAVDEAALAATLTQRQLRLVSASELSLEALIGAHHQTLPRLYQLRVGEQLREALMTGLPAHEAVRAVAAEPLSHPMLGVAPWLQGITFILFVACAVFRSLTGGGGLVCLATGILTFAVVPFVWWILREIYQQRPKRLLRMFASRLERGEILSTELVYQLPGEMKAVMKSKISDTQKAQVAADLVPSLLGGNLKTQQFVMATVGPLAMLGVMMFILYSGLLFVVPRFRDIFEGFGVELPWITQQVIDVSRLVDAMGIVGWVLFALCGCGVLVAVAVLLTNDSVNEVLSNVPVFGMAFRWAMQARVARTLAAMLRSSCTYHDSLRAATASSGFQSVQRMGETMAAQMEAGSGPESGPRLLSGLPMSMLFVHGSTMDHDERRSGIARTFQSLSEMLDAATLAQGRLFSILVQFITLTIGSLLVGITVLALFLPLIKLLNDLS